MMCRGGERLGDLIEIEMQEQIRDSDYDLAWGRESTTLRHSLEIFTAYFFTKRPEA